MQKEVYGSVDSRACVGVPKGRYRKLAYRFGGVMEIDKIKVRLVADEWYPVYEEADGPFFQEEVEISAELWKRYCKALKDFSGVRKELRDAIDE